MNNNNNNNSEKIDITSLKNALNSLKMALDTGPKNDLERDGIIQRFEYTFELSWKMIKRVLASLGRKELSGSPKPLLRDAFEDGLIDNLEEWFGFLTARNLIAHVYGEYYAQQIFEIAKKFPPFVDSLITKLESKINI